MTQVGRTENSVTINVSGITDGDRQTYIWITNVILGTKDGSWMTLQQAKNNGYITEFYTADFDSNNGDITVVIADEYAWEYKVWDLLVENVNTANEPVYISTVLWFNYDNASTKMQGESIDITVSDCIRLWCFGNSLRLWIVGDGEGVDYSIIDRLYMAEKGDEIFADYIRTPAQGILSSIQNVSPAIFPNYAPCHANIQDVVNRCKSGAEFEAQFFEEIKVAINSFNISVTL